MSISFFRLHSSVIYFITYIVAFSAATVLFLLTDYLERPERIIANSLLLLALATVGATLFCSRLALSRIASAATLLTLGMIAMKFDSLPIPDAALLVLAFSVAWVGSHSFWHKPTTIRQSIMRSILVTGCAFLFIAASIYFSLLLGRSANY